MNILSEMCVNIYLNKVAMNEVTRL